MASKPTVFTPDIKAMGLKNPVVRVPTIYTTAPPFISSALKFQVVSDQPVKLDLEKCTEYIDLPIFEGERRLSDGGVQTLVDEMIKGTFNPTNVILASAWLNSKRYKINGQHTAWAAALYNHVYVPTVREIVYRVTSEEQLKLLYNTYDKNRIRTDTFSTKVMLIGSKTAEGAWPSMLSTYVSGCKFWLYGDKRIDFRRSKADQMAKVIETQFQDTFQRVVSFMQDQERCMRTGMRRQAVVAALFATFDKAPNKSIEFWTPVFDGLNLESKNDPRWRLRDTLDRTVLGFAGSTARRSKAPKDKLVMPSDEIYRICIVCWNKWRKGQTLSSSPRPTAERVKPI